MNRAFEHRIHVAPAASFIALRQRCMSRQLAISVAPRQRVRRAVRRPMSRRPKRSASRMCACACDVRDVSAWMGACRKRAHAHLTIFSWDSGTVGRNNERGGE